MGDTYIEYMVKRKTPIYLLIAKWFLIVLEVLIVLIIPFALSIFPIIIATALGFAIYFLVRRWDIEYEYIFQNGELVIDKIMSKAVRKNICTLELTSMELMFKGTDHPEARAYSNYKVKDYTTLCHPENVYTMVFGNMNSKVCFEPNEEMINAIRMMAPRKVKLDQ